MLSPRRYLPPSPLYCRCALQLKCFLSVGFLQGAAGNLEHRRCRPRLTLRTPCREDDLSLCHRSVLSCCVEGKLCLLKRVYFCRSLSLSAGPLASDVAFVASALLLNGDVEEENGFAACVPE